MSKQRTLEYAAQLATMIKIETISSKCESCAESFSRFRELLIQLFPHLFSRCTCESFDGSLLLRWQGSDPHAQPILLMNHHDVVEAGGAWLYPPFSGTVAQNKLWGRGTLDTKGGLFAMLRAADELAAEDFCPLRDIYFVTTCNEETSGAGADAISSALAARGIRFAWVLDEGGMILEEPIAGAKGKFAMIGLGEKGCADLKIIAKSAGGHASTPPKNTPLVRLGKFMAAAERKRLFEVKLSDTVCAMLQSLAPSMSFPLRQIFSHPRLFSPILTRAIPAVSSVAGAMLKTTVAFTMAGGSDAANVLPAEAYLICNMRYSHHQGRENSIDALRRLAQRFDLELEVLDGGFASPLSDHHSEGFAALSDALAATYPDVKPTPYVMTAASDSRYMSRVCDVCLRFTPFLIDDTQLDSVHGINENIDLSTLCPAVDFYRHLLKGANHEQSKS